MSDKIHFKEDTKKPENRVNLTLFHLTMIDELNGFIKSRLGIPVNAHIFPSPNLSMEEFVGCGRPDYRVILDGNNIGFIEVELGPEDKKQIKHYRKIEKAKIYSIVGKKDYKEGDLSLEEIYDFIKIIKGKYLNTQKYFSMQLFEDIIKHYIIDGKFKTASKSIMISDTIRNTKLVDTIYKYFGTENILENENIVQGKIMFNSRGGSGFSLRVYSRLSKVYKSFSLMDRSGGRDFINFPSKLKINKYLPNQSEAVNKYINLIFSLGAKEILDLKENERTSLPLKVVEDNAEKFCNIIKELI